jgi:hypothetical protein
MNLEETRRLRSISVLFRHDERLIYFLFHHMNPRLRLGADELLVEAQGLSRGEYLLVQAALDLWNGEGNLKLADALSAWDGDNVLAFVRAILCSRGLDDEYLLVDDLC